MQELDQDIINCIKKGDESGLKTRLDIYLDRLYGFIYYRVGKNQSDAEDILQETMLVAFDDINSFNRESNLYTWLCGIAKNKVSDFLKKKQKLTSLEALMEKSNSKIINLIESIETESITSSDVENEEVKDITNAVLSALPPHYQKSLIAKYVNGLTVEQIADEMKMGFKAVESLLTRARESFKQAFLLVTEEKDMIL
jgi:RNA polymerase sigma-70 factor (ECF subfamily)